MYYYYVKYTIQSNCFLFIMPVLGWDICTRPRGSFQQNHEYHTLYDLHIPLPKKKNKHCHLMYEISFFKYEIQPEMDNFSKGIFTFLRKSL